MFLRRKPIRQMVCLKERALDFADIMDSGKIFLARIPHGLIGEENGHLLGTLLVSKFHQLAMARQQTEAKSRRPFFLYIDEFHHFVTPSMASILCEARKYRLGLVLAHQELRQLESRGTDISSAVLSNPYTRICFRVGDQDAKKLADGFSFFKSGDLQSLGTGEAICRVERSDFDFNLTTRLLPVLEHLRVEEKRSAAAVRSRERYGVLRSAVVEAAPAEPAPAVVIDIPSAPKIIPDTSPVMADVPKSKPGKKPIIVSDEPTLMGRGGTEHKYLQQLIKQWAQGMGYRALIEAALPAGGSVDISLEKGERRIACETSITNSPTYEVENIRKSLEAEYQFVAVVAPEIKHRSRIESAARAALTSTQFTRVRFFSPEELFAFVQELEINDAKREQTVCGYKVKTSFASASPQEQVMRKQMVAQVVAKSMTRLRKKK